MASRGLGHSTCSSTYWQGPCCLYVAMDVQEASDYGNVREAILEKYSTNSETYRQWFCSMEVLMEETPKALCVRLKDLLYK